MKRLSTITLAAPAIVLLSCFGGLLTGRRTFVFRDSSHYYYPLWQWITRQWQQGLFPLWNPYDNAGAPLAADATASLFYPGKLLFLLPLPFDVAYNLFLLAHFVLAFWLTWRAARRFGVTAAGATLTALSYAFSGTVLAGHANAPYLIGAAWLPLALSASYHLMRAASVREGGYLAVALAMMILGGDVQLAYHMLLVLAFAWWMVPLSANAESVRPPWYRRRGALAAGSCLLAGGLAAVQILPARDWTRQTVRATYDQPRSVYEAVAYLSRRDGKEDLPAALAATADGLFGVPLEDSHHQHSYGFSIGPWRWAELWWPNGSGRMYPVHRRWISAIPGEGRVWAPSLYLGLLPLVLALSAWRLRGGPPQKILRRGGPPQRTLRGGPPQKKTSGGRPQWRWLSWLLLISAVAALGWHGLGWLVHEIHYAWRAEAGPAPAIGPQVGGLYWFFSTLLPGYVYFRYPAKWFVLATLAMSLLAGYGLQVNLRRGLRRSRRLLLGGIGLSGITLAALVIFRQPWLTWIGGAKADLYFGPLDAPGAWLDAARATVHCAVVGGLGYAIFRYRAVRSAAGLGGALVLLTAVDLAVAQHWLAPTAPVAHWQRPSTTAARLASSPTGPAARIQRSRSPAMMPPHWPLESSPNRLIEGLAWERDTLHPKHHLTAGIGSIDVSTAMVSADHAAWLMLARERVADQPGGPPPFAQLSATHSLAPLASFPAAPASASLAEYPHLVLLENKQALPRVRLSRNAIVLPALTDGSATAIMRRTREVMQRTANGETIALESDDRLLADSIGGLAPRPIGPDEYAVLAEERPNRVEIQVKLSSPAVLVLADTYTGDWRGEIRTGDRRRAVPVYRANRLFRGVLLPAGEYRLWLRYAPASLTWGAWLSGICWLILLMTVVRPLQQLARARRRCW